MTDTNGTPELLLDASGNPGLVAAGQLIESAWGNAVVGRVVNRYPNEATMRAASASTGMLAVTTDQNIVWIKTATTWLPTSVGNSITFRLVGGGAGQSFAPSVESACGWTTEESDTSGVMSVGAFTCPTGWPGRWMFEWAVNFAPGIGIRHAYCLAGGRKLGSDTRELVAPAAAVGMTGAASAVLAVGATAYVVVYHTHTAALVVNNTADAYFQGYYVGPA